LGPGRKFYFDFDSISACSWEIARQFVSFPLLACFLSSSHVLFHFISHHITHTIHCSVGLTAALEAKRLGLSVRIIDRKLTRSVHDSRAVVVHPRVMELLEPIRNGDLTSEIQKTAFQLKGMFAYMPKWF
jgi:hypothetical protein